MKKNRFIKNSLHREKFRLRGNEIRRVEALSDAVFAFSVSLLVVSLEVPQTFEELKIILKGAIPFFATVALLFMFWYQQNKFFRQYGLNDTHIIFYNLAYLAVILFYVYPLKFLFSLLISSWTGIDLFPKATEHKLTVLLPHEFPQLVILFSIGYIIIWLLLFLMHQRAIQCRRQLELTPYELEFTLKQRRGALLDAMVGVLALLSTVTGINWLSGACYLLIPVLLAINEKMFRRKIKSL